MLVDAGYAETRTPVYRAVDELGIRPTRLLVTHDDPDRAAGVDAAVDQCDLELCAPLWEGFAGDAVPGRQIKGGDQIALFTAAAVPGRAANYFVYVHREGPLRPR